MIQPVTATQRNAARKAAKLTPAQKMDAFQIALAYEYETTILANGRLTEEQQGVYAELVSCAIYFNEWTDGDPFTFKLPAGYTERLGKCVTWLQAQKTEKQKQAARDIAIKKLRQTWPHYHPIQGDWEAFRGIWLPDPEFGPLSNQKEPYPLPAHGNTIVADWDCYSGAIVHLNQALGLKFTDLSNYEVN